MKNYIILLLILTVQFLNSQSSKEITIDFGPSLTNSQEIVNGEKLFYANPERPFYSIHCHFGVGIEGELFRKNYLSYGIGLSYDQRGSAHSGFNKEKESIYGFIGIPCYLLYKPIESINVKFELGTNFLYLIYRPIYSEPTPFRNFQFDYSVGIRFPIWKSLGTGIRFTEPLILMRGNSNIINSNPNLIEQRKYKTHAIQLNFIYKINI